MTTAALSSSEPDTNQQTRAVPAIEKRSSRPSAKPRAKRPRDKKPSRAEQRREVEGLRALARTAPPNHPAQFGTLLLGAGIGAAITLSVVVIGGKGGRHSALGAAITKSAAYAIAHSSSRGSLVNLLARAVSSALG